MEDKSIASFGKPGPDYDPIASLSPPPPAYSSDPRPVHLWKFCNTAFGEFSPWQPLQTLTWNHVLNEVEWEMDLRSKSFGDWFKKCPITRGPAGSSPPAYVYKNLTWTLASVDKSIEVFCKYKVDQKANVQRLPFECKRTKFEWRASQVMSTCRGNLYDSTTYSLTNQAGALIATFAFIAPDGDIDCCMRITPEGYNCGLSEEIILFTFSIFVFHQWQTMLEELKYAPLMSHVPTLINVRDNLTVGRKILYDIDSREKAECLIEDVKRRNAILMAKRGNGRTSNDGSAATSSVISASY